MRKITTSLLLLVLMMVPILAMSQVRVSQYAMETGVDSTKWYTLPADTSITKTLITNGGDSKASSLTDIGFNFMFGTTAYSQFSVNTDGNLKFGAPKTGTGFYSTPFGELSINENAPKINGMGCDGKMRSGGYVKSAVMGTAPNRVLVVEYFTGKYTSSATTPDVKWQVQLFEGSNEIMLVYASEAPTDAPNQFQIGMATSDADVLTVNTASGVAIVGVTEEKQSQWPAVNTFYRFYTPTCIRTVGLAMTAIDAYSASFIWNQGLGQTAWQYLCIPVDDTPDWTTAVSVNDTNATVGELIPNTDYAVYVRTDCGGEGYSDATMIQFHTACIALDVPYVEDFESYSENSFPNCWTASLSSSRVAENTNWTAYSHEGTKSLRLGAGEIVMAPKVRLAANEMMLLAYIKSEDPDAGTVEIGYVTDPSRMDFTSMLTIAPVHNTYQEYMVDYSSLDITDTIYVAFKHNEGDYSWYHYYVDDIQIMRATNCQRPSYVYARNITHNSATITWQANENVASYDVAYGLTDTLANATLLNVLSGEDSLHLDNLMSNTTYYAWVRSNCDEDSSLWRKAVPFTTYNTCAEVTNLMVSSINNNTAAINWNINNSYGEEMTAVELSYKLSADSAWSTPVILNQNYYILSGLESGYGYDVRVRTICGGEFAEYVQVSFVTTPCGTTLESISDIATPNLPFGGFFKYAFSQMLYPAANLSGVDTIQGLSFKVDRTSAAQTRIIDVYMGVTTQDALTATTPIEMQSLDLVATDKAVVADEGWVSVMFDSTFVYDGTSNLIVCVSDHSGYYQQHIYINYSNTIGSSLFRRSDEAIFNVGDSVPSALTIMSGTPDIMFISGCHDEICVAPIVALGDITQNSIALHWATNANTTQWMVEYKSANEETWSVETATETSFVLTELTAGTLYDIKVGAVCGGDTLYSQVQVYTDCAIYTMPFTESFDDNVLECWTIGKTSSKARFEWRETGGILDFSYNGGGYIITPELADDINTLQVSFSLGARESYNSGALVVSVGESIDNLNTFVSIDTIFVPEGAPLSSQLVPLDSYTGMGHYVMFSSFTGDIIMDNIVIETIPECSMPTNLVASNITSDGATITWVDAGLSVEKWLVSYIKLGQETGITYEVAADEGQSHTVTGLEANTSYIVTVTTVCTMGDSVITLYPINFRTNCAVVTIPYFEDFEGINPGEFHLCWYRDAEQFALNSYYGFQRIPVPTVFSGEHGGNTIIMAKDVAIVSPLIPLPANQISLNFDMRTLDTVHSGDILVGFTTNPNDYSNMTIIDTIYSNDVSWNNYTVDFNTISLTDTGYVVLKNVNNIPVGSGFFTNDYFVWLDNISFSEYSSCDRIQSATISNITATTATVNITDNANRNNYIVAWNTTSDVTTATTITATTPNVQLTNLQPGTTYYAWARAVCSNTENSAWIIAGSFKTECLPIELPYEENFEDYTYGVAMGARLPVGFPNHTLPDCWKVLNMNIVNNQPYVAISNDVDFVADGSNALFVKCSAVDSIFIVLPRFAPSIDSLMLSFDYIQDSPKSNVNEFEMGVMTDPQDPATFIPLDQIEAARIYTSYEHSFVLDAGLDPNTTYYIAFRAGGVHTYLSMGIDNVKVEYAPSCIRPDDLSVAQYGSTTMSIAWSGNSANYEVQYRLNDTTAAWTSVNVNTNSANLTGLLDGTTYQVRTRGVCGTDNFSEWSRTFIFTTLCSPAAIPWSENFESYTTDVADDYSRPNTYPHHTMPTCWTFSPMTSSSYGGPASWLTAEPNSTWSPYNTIDGISLRFYSNDQYHMYATLPAMGANIDTLALYFDYVTSSSAAPLVVGVITNPYDYSTFRALQTYPASETAHSAEHYFSMDNLDPNQTYYITFDAGISYSSSSTIDNIVVDYLPSCIRPGALVAYADDVSAILKWGSVASSAEVTYRATTDDVWTNVVVNADSVIITDLTGNTNYEYAVRSICGDGDTSIWSDTMSFTTECSAFNLPYTENFDGLASLENLQCWSFYTGLVNDILYNGGILEKCTGDQSKWYKKSEFNDFTTAHAYINIYGTERNDWLVSPILAITSNATLSFDVSYTHYNTIDPADEFDDDRFYVMITADNGMTWNKLITWGPDSTDTYPLDSLNIHPDSISVDLSQFAGQKVRLAFYGESTEYGGDNDIRLDNVFVDGAPCGEPTDVVATPEAVSAIITWQGSGQDYEIAIREGDATTWPDAVAVTGLTYTFTGLMPEVTYAYRVRQSCGEGLYSNWYEGAFATLSLPCEKPVVAVTNITGDGATFTWAQGENHTDWEVNVFNAMLDTTLDVTAPTATITDLEHATSYSVAVRAKCAENVYSDWSDTIEFTTLDCLPVTGVAISEITTNSAKVTWTAGSAESAWEINYGESDFGQGQGEFADATTNSYTITRLEADLDYDVYVRAICSENFYSIWSDVVTFTTLNGDIPEGIDGINGDFQFVIYPNPTNNATTISLNGVEGKVIISIVDMNGRMLTAETIECGSDCEKRIDVAHLAQGTYFVRVLGDNINSVRKLIIK